MRQRGLSIPTTWLGASFPIYCFLAWFVTSITYRPLFSMWFHVLLPYSSLRPLTTWSTMAWGGRNWQMESMKKLQFDTVGTLLIDFLITFCTRFRGTQTTTKIQVNPIKHCYLLKNLHNFRTVIPRWSWLHYSLQFGSTSWTLYLIITKLLTIRKKGQR